jgi:hypothetical protein
MKDKIPHVGRNEPCPCGSGKKFKHCHLRQAGKASPGQRLLYFILAAVAAGGLYLAIASRAEPTGRTTGVWSAEHGHYH